jgi:hypothetical protein
MFVRKFSILLMKAFPSFDSDLDLDSLVGDFFEAFKTGNFLPGDYSTFVFY